MAILAGLAAAIAAASGSFNGDISAVKAKAQATAILGYVNELQIGVDRVMSRCPDTEISLANSVDPEYPENPLAPSDKSCHVFDVNGGGVLFKEPPPDVNLTAVSLEARNYAINTQHNIRILGRTFGYSGVLDDTGRDLVIFLPGLTRELCLKINEMVGVTIESGDAPIHANDLWCFKELDYWTNGTHGLHFGCGPGPNWNKLTCCTKLAISNDSRIPAGSYVLYHALHVR
ncbi:MAG: hypothetical protein IPI58_01745 [Alphaproteobacteria bacterium]|nr:MAG: hypothetical protein IPI58_01745 [Alphaproteobacteria bacterium]